MRSSEPIYSPNNIEVLLHFHTFRHPHPRMDAEAVQEAIGMFMDAGAIVEAENHGCYRTTAFGSAWVQALCNVCPPKRVFVDVVGNILGKDE